MVMVRLRSAPNIPPCSLSVLAFRFTVTNLQLVYDKLLLERLLREQQYFYFNRNGPKKKYADVVRGKSGGEQPSPKWLHAFQEQDEDEAFKVAMVKSVGFLENRDQGLRIRNQGSRIKDQGSKIKDRGSRIKDQENFSQ